MATELVSVTEKKTIEKENQTIIVKANDFSIVKPEHETTAYGILQEIKGRLAVVEKKRTSITKPLNASLKEVNALFKGLSEPLKEADGILRSKIGAFRRKQEEEARKREEVLRKKAEAEAAEIARLDALKRKTAAKKEEIVQRIERQQELETKADLVQAKVGAASVTKRWTFEVVDSKKVPREYVMVDVGKVRAAVRDGVREIAGVRIYQTESVRVL